MPTPIEFRALYDEHVSFVWRSLRRLGVPESDLPDAAQEVFVVAHRKLPEFEGRSRLTTWLFGICTNVASDRRRLAHVRRELATPNVAADDRSPVDTAAIVDQQRARQTLDAIMSRMPEEQRIVFALFELDELGGDDIAELLDVPVGTVRSRLRLAREFFQEAVERLRARERTVRAVPSPFGEAARSLARWTP
jgi:RNA polymerase sigma-70 factor (ECF subfamily)